MTTTTTTTTATTTTILHEIESSGLNAITSQGKPEATALSFSIGGWVGAENWTTNGKNVELGITRFGLVDVEKHPNISNAYMQTFELYPAPYIPHI